MLLVVALAPGQAIASDPIRFAPLPLEDPKIIHEQFGGLMDFLQQQTGLTLRWTPFADYLDILTAFRRGELDLAYLGPLPYVILRRDDPAARSLACFRDADGAAAYTCSMVAFAGSGVDLAQLDGRRIGLTQPFSTCGYLAVSEMLSRAGTSLEQDGVRYDYAGSHSRAALGVVRGDYDLAGVKTSIAHRYTHLNLDIVAESRPYPGFTLVANTETLGEHELDLLARALARLDPDLNPGYAGLTAGWGKQIENGTVPPERCDYSGIRTTLEQLPWPIPGTGGKDPGSGLPGSDRAGPGP